MIEPGQRFLLGLAAAALAGFVLAGGTGLVVVGFAAFAFKLAPYRRGLYWDCPEAWRGARTFERQIAEATRRPEHPVRHVVHLALSVAVMAWGIVRIETPGVLG